MKDNTIQKNVYKTTTITTLNNNPRNSFMDLISQEKIEEANKLLFEKIISLKENEELKFTYKSDFSGLKTFK